MGNLKITSEGHIENEFKNLGSVLVETFWRPFEIMIFKPVVMLIKIYLGLLYAIVYLWFEAFHIVFSEVYEFSLVGMGTSYVCLIVCNIFGFLFYLPVIYKFFTLKVFKGGKIVPELFLVIFIVGRILLPFGLMVLAWTATSSIHWSVLVIGGGIFMFRAFLIFQPMVNYIGMRFPRLFVFAGNAFFRAILGGAFPLLGKALFFHFSTPKFPAAWFWHSFIMTIMILIPVLFYLNGPVESTVKLCQLKLSSDFSDLNKFVQCGLFDISDTKFLSAS